MAKTKSATKKLCPSTEFFYEPSLKALDALGGSGSTGEIYKKVLSIANLSNEVVDEMHSFTMSEVEYRLMWARTDLKNFGAVVNSKQGVWSLTSKGAKLAKSGKIDTKEIKKVANLNKKKGKAGDEDEECKKKTGVRKSLKYFITLTRMLLRSWLSACYENVDSLTLKLPRNRVTVA